MTRDDIVKRHPSRVTDLFRGIVSVKVVDSSGVKMIASTRAYKVTLNPPAKSARQRAFGGFGPGGNDGGVGDCILRTAVDGFVLPWGFDLDQLAAEDIAGIEIFPGSGSLPAQYAGTSNDKGCGLVMIWTR